MSDQWFSVDRAGLGKQAQQHSKGRLIGELVQNALDEAGVTQIAVTLALVPGRPLADLTVEDDSPEGFKDLSHAYTLFTDHPLHIAAGSMPPQNGFGLGGAFVWSKNTRNWRMSWDFDAVGAMELIELVRVANQ